MTIEQIDGSKVLIILGSKDMQNFSLEYDTLTFQDPHSKKILRRLLSLACTKAELSVQNKKMVVEALPHNSGCLILLTLKPKVKRKIYTIKKLPQDICCTFETTENLFSFARAFSKNIILPKSSLYYYGDNYCVIMEDINHSKSFVFKTREFCDKYISSKIYSAKVKEYGEQIIAHNAIKKINEYFC